MRYVAFIGASLAALSCILAGGEANPFPGVGFNRLTGASTTPQLQTDHHHSLLSKRDTVTVCTTLRLSIRDAFLNLESRYEPIRESFFIRSMGDIDLVAQLDTAKGRLDVPMLAIIQRHEFFNAVKGKAIMEAADQMWRVLEEMKRRYVVVDEVGGVYGEMWGLVVMSLLGETAKYLTIGCAN